MNDNVTTHIQAIVSKANLGAIILPANPSADAVACATALYLGLTKLGKTISLCAASAVNFDLVATDKISDTLTATGDNLVVSFPYTDGSIDKVDYNISGNQFNLIVTPRPGFPKLDEKQVKFSYAGGNLDFVMTIDSPTLNALGEIYTNNQNQFQGRDIINIDRHLTNAFYGTVNYVNKTASSISEIGFHLLRELGVEIDKDMATNLYAGIATATNNFTSYSVNADTFEAIAQLLRFGAIKKSLKPINQPAPRQNSSFLSRPFSEKQTTPIQVVEKESQPEQAATPQDWLKPKIFRGGGGMV